MYEAWKIAGPGGELVQLHMEGDRLTATVQPVSGFMTAPESGSEEPVTMPRENAEALAFILANSSIAELRGAKAVKA
jgi:hypothetical protein